MQPHLDSSLRRSLESTGVLSEPHDSTGGPSLPQPYVRLILLMRHTAISSTGCRSIFSPLWTLPWAAGSAWSTSSPSVFSDLGVQITVSHTFFLTPRCCVAFFLFLKYLFKAVFFLWLQWSYANGCLLKLWAKITNIVVVPTDTVPTNS